MVHPNKNKERDRYDLDQLAENMYWERLAEDRRQSKLYIYSGTTKIKAKQIYMRGVNDAVTTLVAWQGAGVDHDTLTDLIQRLLDQSCALI